MSGKAFLILPKITQGFLATMASGASADCGVVPEWEGFYQGLAAVYPKKILPLLAEVLGGTNHSLQYLNRLAVEQGLMRVHQVAETEEGFFQNWTSLDDINK